MPTQWRKIVEKTAKFENKSLKTAKNYTQIVGNSSKKKFRKKNFIKN